MRNLLSRFRAWRSERQHTRELRQEYPIGTWFWHVHHMDLAERLTEPLKNRINYIFATKSPWEITRRLDLLSPIKATVPDWIKWSNLNPFSPNKDPQAMKFLSDLHKVEHPNCPWDGKTIFPDEDQLMNQWYLKNGAPDSDPYTKYDNFNVH